MKLVRREWPTALRWIAMDLAQRGQELGRVVPTFFRHTFSHPRQLSERVGTWIDTDDAGSFVAELPEVNDFFIWRSSCRSISADASASFT